MSVQIPFPPDHAARFYAEGHWGDLTLPGLFARNLARTPDAPGLSDPPNRASLCHGAPRRLSYARMDAEIAGYAAALRAAGLGRGDIVATQLPNIAEVVLIYLAAARIGAILSPVSMAYRGNELRGMVDTVDFRAFISVTQFRGQDFLAAQMPALDPATVVLALGDTAPEGAHLLRPVPDAGPGDGIAAGPDDLFAIFWTSGTEGRPKAVPKTHNNMMATSGGAYRLLQLPAGANVLAAFPFVNAAAIGGLMMCWMRTGGELLLHHPFDIDVFLDQLNGNRVDYTIIAPTLLVYLRDRFDDPRVRNGLAGLIAVATGSAPPDPEIFEFFQVELDIPIVNFFGSNEGAQLCSQRTDLADARTRARFFPRDGDINWPANGTRRTANGGTFKLVDPETGRAVTRSGVPAEMCIEGPALLPGYYSRGGFDRSRFDADGFFPTGDLFEISEDGRMIRFHSRAKDLIVRGGMKIAPAELDAILSAMPRVREMAVAPYDDPVMGQKICAVFVMQPGQGITLEEVTAFCDRRGVAKFKWPEMVVEVAELPKTPLAKIDRKRLVSQLGALMRARRDPHATGT